MWEDKMKKVFKKRKGYTYSLRMCLPGLRIIEKDKYFSSEKRYLFFFLDMDTYTHNVLNLMLLLQSSKYVAFQLKKYIK